MPTKSIRAQLAAAKKDSLNASFDYVLRVFGQDLPAPVREFRFDAKRRWLLDYAFLEAKVGIELDGGGKGRPVTCHNCGSAVRARKADGSLGAVIRLLSPSHYSEAGHARDNEKRNALTLQGWAVLSYTSAQLEATPQEIAAEVTKLVNARA